MKLQYHILIILSCLVFTNALRCLETDECRNSNVITITYPDSYYNCMLDCQNSPYCNYATFYSDQDFCVLLKDCVERESLVKSINLITSQAECFNCYNRGLCQVSHYASIYRGTYLLLSL